MITTVTLNAAIDKTYIVSGFALDKLYRVEQMTATAGGKGINVARVIHALGEEVTASGFAAGFHGQMILHKLNEEGIPADFVHVEGESRVCLNILDPGRGTQTELLEQGPAVTLINLDAMRDKVGTLAARSTHIVFSGSLPQGCPPALYAELIEIARRAGAIPILDTSGAALEEGVKSAPALIKPNEHEVGKLTGGGADASEDEVMPAIRRLMDAGIEQVVISLGARGALAGVRGALYRVTLPAVEAINPVGSGDSMVAGLVVADKRGLSAEDGLTLGAACGTANALMPSAGHVRLDDVESLRTQIQVERIG
ncbi:1-phosphofructokinase [Paenibacillus thiaminolyticus]|uniref:1-phosphofructokinase n=1 Tax=Paenibacillus thiaminolyticus TaxID=49283 RepID=UPI003D2A2F7C